MTLSMHMDSGIWTWARRKKGKANSEAELKEVREAEQLALKGGKKQIQKLETRVLGGGTPA